MDLREKGSRQERLRDDSVAVGVTLRENTCLSCMRSWVLAPAPQKDRDSRTTNCGPKRNENNPDLFVTHRDSVQSTMGKQRQALKTDSNHASSKGNKLNGQ